jgi:enoyl-CoA hydratase
MAAQIGIEHGRVSILTLRRPEQRNALNEEMLDGLLDALAALAKEEDVRCVLLQGEGKHFCAGADFADVSAGAADGARYGAGFENLLRAIEDHPVPIVAKVQGAALGAGCQILAAADLSVAAENAVIGIPSARLGLLLDLEKIGRLVRALGAPRVRELLLTGRSINGVEADEWGLVTLAVPPDELDTTAMELCDEVASAAPLSIRGSKAAIRDIMLRGALSRTVDAELFAEHDARALQALMSQDLQEGMRALKEGRPPEFEGR